MTTPADHPAANYPSWLTPAKLPVTVIVGPPGNGARAHIDATARAGDIIIDINAIFFDLCGLSPSDPARAAWAPAAFTRRNAALAALATARDDDVAAWVISPAPRAWQRSWWAERLGAVVQLLDPGRSAAIAGARAEGVAEKWVHQWYAEAAGDGGAAIPVARPRAGDDRESASARGYGSRHRALRDKQLAREPWCRICRDERGQNIPATVLDHEKPFRRPDNSIDWKLWGDPKNHRSLCGPCHDSRGAQRNRPEKPPGAGVDGRPIDPAHPWNQRS
jgi:hypothetical protein